ncbi:MAG: NifB/NifX family molybdenum-iron cluster-binding protein [Bacteroidota bacterium]
MKIAFTSDGTTWDSMIDPRFGRTEYILVFDEQKQVLSISDNSAVKNEAHGAGTATSQKIYELKPDVLITGNGPGETALKALEHLEMKIFINANGLTVKQAYDQYRKGRLTELPVKS